MQRIAGSADSTMLRRGKRSFCDSLALLVGPSLVPFASRFAPSFPVFCLFSRLFASVNSVPVPLDFTTAYEAVSYSHVRDYKLLSSLFGGHRKITSGHESEIKAQR